MSLAPIDAERLNCYLDTMTFLYRLHDELLHSPVRNGLLLVVLVGALFLLIAGCKSTYEPPPSSADKRAACISTCDDLCGSDMQPMICKACLDNCEAIQ